MLGRQDIFVTGLQVTIVTCIYSVGVILGQKVSREPWRHQMGRWGECYTTKDIGQIPEDATQQNSHRS